MRRVRALVGCTTVFALLASGCVWSFETLDGEGGKPGSSENSTGEYSSAVMYNGRPHVFYYDDSGGNLRHAYYNGFAWVFETLDGNGGPNGRINSEVGMHTSVVIYNGRPHVFYFYSGNGDLRHAWYNGTAWSFESLDGHQVGPNGQTNVTMGRYTSAVIYNGRPHVFYEGVPGVLRHAWYNGLVWSAETLDGGGGPNGRINADVGEHADATNYAGRPHVYYYDNDNDDLRHGYYNGQFWAFETLDGAGGPNGRLDTDTGIYPSAVTYAFRPHIFYYDNSDRTLRHGYYNGQFWAFETLDGMGSTWPGSTNGDVGEYTAAVVHNGLPRVYHYWHEVSYGLREARYTGSTWVFTTIDGVGGGNGATTGDVGNHSATLVDGTRLRVFYTHNGDNALRHAWFG